MPVHRTDPAGQPNKPALAGHLTRGSLRRRTLTARDPVGVLCPACVVIALAGRQPETGGGNVPPGPCTERPEHKGDGP